MKTREIVSRCLKARVVSWLTISQQAVVLPSVDGGGGCILAVYDNGRYMEPELVRVPDGVPPGWGPDGPLQGPAEDGDNLPEEDEDK